MVKFSMAVAVLGVVVAAAAGCGSSTTATAGSSSTAPASESVTPVTGGPTITISGMAFGDPLTVSPGATITIVNKDTVEHSVTSDPKGPFSTDVDGGEQKTFTAPTQPGTYPFVCKYHPNMKGTLTVT